MIRAAGRFLRRVRIQIDLNDGFSAPKAPDDRPRLTEKQSNIRIREETGPILTVTLAHAGAAASMVRQGRQACATTRSKTMRDLNELELEQVYGAGGKGRRRRKRRKAARRRNGSNSGASRSNSRSNSNS
jgi:hypothetical protein